MINSTEIRSRLLASASQYLKRHPACELTIPALMEHAGMVRSSFYRYFSELDDVFEFLMPDIDFFFHDAMRGWLANRDEDEKTMIDCLATLLKYYYDNGPLIRATQEASMIYPSVGQKWRSLLHNQASSVAKRLSGNGYDIEEAITKTLSFSLIMVPLELTVEYFGYLPRNDFSTCQFVLQQIWRNALS
jgi:AcrR family transcriptional regulator